MSETQQFPQDNEKDPQAGHIDFLNGLADAFEAQGNVVEAERYRDLARRQPELRRKSIAEMSAHLDKKQQEQWQNIPANQQPEIHPENNARSNKGLREEIEKMLQVKSPISPNTAAKPSTPGTGEGVAGGATGK